MSSINSPKKTKIFTATLTVALLLAMVFATVFLSQPKPNTFTPFNHFEFPAWAILPLITLAALTSVTIAKRNKDSQKDLPGKCR